MDFQNYLASDDDGDNELVNKYRELVKKQKESEEEEDIHISFPDNFDSIKSDSEIEETLEETKPTVI